MGYYIVEITFAFLPVKYYDILSKFRLFGVLKTLKFKNITVRFRIVTIGVFLCLLSNIFKLEVHFWWLVRVTLVVD